MVLTLRSFGHLRGCPQDDTLVDGDWWESGAAGNGMLIARTDDTRRYWRLGRDRGPGLKPKGLWGI